MAFERRRFSAVLVHFFLCSFMSFSSAEVGNDISCLMSIKGSLEDPSDSLHTWDFNYTSMDDICSKFRGVTCSYSVDRKQVWYIELGSMGLKGQFPQGIETCSSLLRLNLSHNKLSGYIPPDIFSMFPSLFRLDLSYNKFSGNIPTSIGNLSDLSILRLNNNEFIGKIPRQLGELTFLTEFSVANNLLSGPVPVFSSNVDAVKKESYLNNKGLCGGPLEPCDPFHQSFREGLMAGYVFSATSVIVIYLSYCVPWTQLKKARRKKPEQVGAYQAFITRKRKKEEQKEENQIEKLHFDLPEKRYQSLLHLDLQEKRCPEITIAERLYGKIGFTELCDATDLFSVESAIGVGSIGIMYKGRLPNGWFVAVKRLHDSQLFKRQFDLETMILGRYRHRNIVPLVGFCVERVERNERILVYKYMPNGRLSDSFSKGNDDVTLKWPVRVRIALGIARGLCWLHHNLHVFHFNICSECILLDQNFEPKISNFGEARFIRRNTGNDLDTSFDMDNWSNNEIGFEKLDVYKFGIVLLELLSGKRVGIALIELLSGKRFNPRTGSFICNDGSVFVTGTTCLSKCPSGFRDAIDKFLIGEGFDDEIFTLLTIACYCIQPFLHQRPTMVEVYNKMSNIWERNEIGEDLELSKKSEVASATTSRDEIVEIESI